MPPADLPIRPLTHADRPAYKEYARLVDKVFGS